MLKIFICEDNKIQRENIEKCIENCIMIHNLDMKIALSTKDPEEVIAYLESNNVAGLYFLDYNLNHTIDGMKLASVIREYDPRGFIVFITTYSEAMPFTFRYKVEAMDFIIKEEFFELQTRVHECILNAHKKYMSKATELQKNFSFKVADKIIAIEYSKIYYFETSQESTHKVCLHTADGQYEFYGSLKDLEKDLDKGFFRCHNSYIINTKNVQRVDKKTMTVCFVQNDVSCAVSARKMKPLADMLKKKD